MLLEFCFFEPRSLNDECLGAFADNGRPACARGSPASMPPMQLDRASRYANNSGVSTALGEMEDQRRKLMEDLAAPIAAAPESQSTEAGPRFS